MTPRTSGPRQDPAASRAIDAIIKAPGEDPKHVFNTRLDRASMRAVDFREGDTVSEAALRALIRQAVKLNTSKARTRRCAV